MQGTKAHQSKLFYGFSLEAVVPKDDFYRRLEQAVDLSWVRSKVAHRYAAIGRPSIDPEVIVKIELIAYLEGITSERQLMRQVHDRLSLRRYLGYDIDEVVPDHSTLSKARDLLGRELFQEVFAYSVRLCQAAGMVGGLHVSGDRTLVKANAALDSLEPRGVHQTPEQFVEHLFVDNPVPKDEPTTAHITALTERFDYPAQLPLDADAPTDDAPASAQAVPAVPVKAKAADGPAVDKAKVEGKDAKSAPSNATHVSRTDPEAKIICRQGLAPMLAYSAEVWTDARQGVITYADATYATMAEHETVVRAVGYQREALGLPVAVVSADKGYGQGRLYRQLEAAGIVGFIPHHKNENPASAAGLFKPEVFAYDGERGVYRCPNGCELGYVGLKVEWPRLRRVWRADARDCRSCELHAKCTKAKGGRELKISAYQSYYEEMDRRLLGPGARLAATVRRTGPEPRFGQGKRWQGLGRAKYRGLDKVRGQVLLTAAAQNLRKYVNWIWHKGQGEGRIKAAEIKQCLLSLLPALHLPRPGLFLC